MIINWSRGYFYDTLNGEDATKNYKKQSVIAPEMKTTNPDGTDGQGVTAGLNEFVLKPFPAWSVLLHGCNQRLSVPLLDRGGCRKFGHATDPRCQAT